MAYPLPAVPAVGPDALQLGGLLVEAPKRAAGDGLVVAQADHQGTVRRGEFLGGIGAQPFRDRFHRSAIPAGVLQRQFRQQGFGQRVTLVDRLEAELINGVRGHHLTV